MRKRAPAKKVGVSKKKPKKKPADDATEFNYQHGKEIIRTTRRKSAK